MKNNYAIVVSEFNPEITDELLTGAMSRLIEQDIPKANIKVITVPGAIEIPLIAKVLAKQNQYAAIICLGAVIRGDTSHYDYVCQQVSHGCMQVMLEHEIPVIFGVLTTDTLEQAQDRIGGSEGHKGVDAADTALAMAEIMQDLTPMNLSLAI